MTDNEIPKDLNELAARMSAKAAAMRSGVAPDSPQVIAIHDPLNSRDMEKVRALFQKVMDVKDAITVAPSEQINAEMAMSSMYKEVSQEKLPQARKRELGRDIDVYRAYHGDIEAKLSVLMMKFEDFKFTAMQCEKIEKNEVGEKKEAALEVGKQRAFYTMEDIVAVLKAADLPKTREGFINYGTPTKQEQEYLGKAYDRAIAEGQKPKTTRDEYIKSTTPSDDEKQTRSKMFDDAMHEIKQLGIDTKMEAKFEAAMPALKTAATKTPETEIMLAGETIGLPPTAIRQGLPPVPDKQIC